MVDVQMVDLLWSRFSGARGAFRERRPVRASSPVDLGRQVASMPLGAAGQKQVEQDGGSCAVRNVHMAMGQNPVSEHPNPTTK